MEKLAGGGCLSCQIECEIEWRTRIALADAQRAILRHFQGKTDVWIDEYRVKRFAKYQRRIGTRSRYSRYAFATVGDWLALHGLSPFYKPETTTWPPRKERPHDRIAVHSYPFSEIKTTNCAHAFYAFADNAALQENNRRPRLFVFKRSLEITQVEGGGDDSMLASCAGGPDEQKGIDLARAEEATLFANTVNQLLADYERVELDRSDNNLGCAYIRKIYRILPLDGYEKTPHSEKGRGRVRLAVYSIFDEYQQIRHEIGVEYEFHEQECICANAVPGHAVTQAPACLSAYRVTVAAGATRLDTILSSLSKMIGQFISPCIDYVEKPMITINVDWLEDITSPSMIRMLSYTLPPERREDEDNFVDYVTDRLASLICPPRSCGQDGSGHHYFLRRKLDGERLYATYDGGHLLCLSNGQCLDLQQLGYQKKGCAGFFSVDFVYQIEKLGEQDYYFTEIVAARHSYSTVLSSLVHSFSPSRNYYRATDEQIWPYALIGTGLDNHATASLVDFWTTSACSETAGFLTREFVERLRGDGRRPPVSLCRKKSHALSEQNGQSGQGTDDEAGSVSSLDPVLAEKKTHEYSLLAESVPSSAMSTLSEPSGSFSDETEAQNKANGDDSVRSVAGSDADGFSDRQGEGVKTEQKFTNEKATTPTDTHSRFFVPISAGDSRRYLMALHTALSSCAEANPPPAAKNAVRLAVNVPINVDSLNRQELYDYYRAYITRLLNVLFLCGEAGRCTDYAYKHFSREYAARLCLAFETHRLCQNTAVAVVMHDGRICNQLAIDGYLLYRESHNTARRPKGTAFCALPSPIQERRDTTTVLKIKPFQTVELLMRVNIEGTAGHGVNETVRLAAIEFLSHLRSDGSPSVFFTCTFKTVATEETVTMTPQGSTVNGNAVTRKPLCTMSPDFTSARWTRYDGKSMRVFVDPRLELVDGLVYEFLCYNELELYLIKARPDKVLPDDEMKINSILWGRYSSDLFFVS